MTTKKTYEMPFFQPIPEIQNLSESEILCCQNIRQAVRLSLNQSFVKRTDEDWADLLHTSPGNLAQILNGTGKRKRHIPDHWFELLPQLTGNNAVGQWMILFPIRKHKARIMKTEAMKLMQQAELLEAAE